MNVWLVGCSHHRTPFATLERLAFDREQSVQCLKGLHLKYPWIEGVLLSTCNRTELYVTSRTPDRGPTFDDLQQILLEGRGLPGSAELPQWYELAGPPAVQHLFLVTSGLDSMIIGETQILAQVKRAYQTSIGLKIRLPQIHRLFQAAIRAARRVSRETELHSLRLNIPRLAISHFVRQTYDSLRERRCLLIGSGMMAKQSLLYLRGEVSQDIAIVNRTGQTAIDLATAYGGRAVDWSELPEQLVAADIVIGATSAQQPVVGRELLKRLVPLRGGRPLLMLDLAIPRNFEPAVSEFPEVRLYTIQDFQAECDLKTVFRQRDLDQAEEIVKRETELFMNHCQHRNRVPTIARFKAQAIQVKELELHRLMNKLGPLGERQRYEIETAFHRLTNKLLHPPLESLRRESNGNQHDLLIALHQLYQLDD